MVKVWTNEVYRQEQGANRNTNRPGKCPTNKDLWRLCFNHLFLTILNVDYTFSEEGSQVVKVRFDLTLFIESVTQTDFRTFLRHTWICAKLKIYAENLKVGVVGGQKLIQARFSIWMSGLALWLEISAQTIYCALSLHKTVHLEISSYSPSSNIRYLFSCNL